jgi:hypothetical protein
MTTLLIHGCYDLATLRTLKEKRINEFSFDLRGRSPNLIPLKELQDLLKHLTTEKLFLEFENDKYETIVSYLDLLKNESFEFTLLFRDSMSAEFYGKFKKPFYWMFSPESDWKNILSLNEARGVLLPLNFQVLYGKMPELWDFLESKKLNVYLHASRFEECLFMNLEQEFKLSIDLTSEVEFEYRKVDQDKLKNLQFWRAINENSSGQ